MINNRRGYNGDVPLLLTFVFVLGIVVMSGAEILGGINEKFQASDLGPEAKEIIQEQDTRYSQVWDGAFVLVFGLFAVSLVLSTAALGTRPAFFFVTVLVGLFVVGLAAVFSNIFSSFSSSIGSAGDFTFIPLLMNNLVEAALVLIALLVIGLFVKARDII